MYYYYHCNSKCGYKHSSRNVNSAFEKELVKYDFHTGVNTLLKEIILSNFKYIQENTDGKKNELSEQIVNSTNRLSSEALNASRSTTPMFQYPAYTSLPHNHTSPSLSAIPFPLYL